MKTVGVLYICTGRYVRFWRDFYLSASRMLFREAATRVEYFVFTDSAELPFDHLPEVHRIPIAQQPWPDATLLRYHFFVDAQPLISGCDYLYFCNANARFVRDVAADILPRPQRPLVLVQHPGYLDSDIAEMPYCRDSASTACVALREGEYYFMGGINGGRTDRFLQMAIELKRQIDQDRAQGVLATWHDESHLNRYAIDHADELTVLGAEYGYPQGWDLPLVPRIEIRDKSRLGGHAYLRGQESRLRSGLRKMLSWW